ncbi:MAG TPA: hypothetical protein VHL09_16360 [Dehalococcoidia bacterium]|nr:hypothetical protein [Dehalococcoidia bacterium]
MRPVPDPSRFAFRPMTGPEARTVADWRYPEPFATAEPARDLDVLGRLLEPDDPREDAFLAVDAAAEVSGFLVCRRDHSILDVAFGLRPDLVGQGHGWSFLLAALLFAKRRYAPNVFRVTVAADNHPARSLLQDADFVPMDTVYRTIDSGEQVFLRLIRKV